jgi:hypothetical protein
MRNISLNAEDIRLSPGGLYYVLDTLYVNGIKRELGESSVDDMPTFIREKVFPYADYPFAIIDTKGRSDDLVIHTADILSLAGRDTDADFDSQFVTDTGLIIFVRMENLPDLISVFDYNDLTETFGKHDAVNLEYWDGIAARYRPNEIALISAPGIGSGYEFDGSGHFMIRI